MVSSPSSQPLHVWWLGWENGYSEGAALGTDGVFLLANVGKQSSLTDAHSGRIELRYLFSHLAHSQHENGHIHSSYSPVAFLLQSCHIPSSLSMASKT